MRIYYRKFDAFYRLGDYVIKHSGRLKTFLAYIEKYNTEVLVTVNGYQGYVTFKMVGMAYEFTGGIHSAPIYGCLSKMRELAEERIKNENSKKFWL